MHPTTRELEASLEAYFRKKVRTLGGHLVKLAPTEKGVPDRLVLLPCGRMYLVELKADGGALQPAQRYWHEKVSHLGTKVVVLEGRGQIHQWIVARAEELACEEDAVRIAKKSPEYQLGYKSGYRTACDRRSS